MRRSAVPLARSAAQQVDVQRDAQRALLAQVALLASSSCLALVRSALTLIGRRLRRRPTPAAGSTRSRGARVRPSWPAAGLDSSLRYRNEDMEFHHTQRDPSIGTPRRAITRAGSAAATWIRPPARNTRSSPAGPCTAHLQPADIVTARHDDDLAAGRRGAIGTRGREPAQACVSIGASLRPRNDITVASMTATGVSAPSRRANSPASTTVSIRLRPCARGRARSAPRPSHAPAPHSRGRRRPVCGHAANSAAFSASHPARSGAASSPPVCTPAW